jgi:hypothetical protein
MTSKRTHDKCCIIQHSFTEARSIFVFPPRYIQGSIEGTLNKHIRVMYTVLTTIYANNYSKKRRNSIL